ncbi:hypothetical protein BRC62_03840 [Halobacteriales archaeon QH_10_67_13]|nr:MAG: hypothetical protein BRC62_03840 [Halobacteriales archaeon QH_10_67_13]
MPDRSDLGLGVAPETAKPSAALRSVVPSRRSVRGAGVAVGLVTLGLFGYVIGFTELLDTLGTLSLAEVVLLVALGLAPIALWGAALWVTLAAMDEPTTPARATLLFAVSLFFNGVTPFGQTGGAALTGGVIAHAVRAPYERALAAIASVSAINTVVALGFWLLGGAYLGIGRDVADARQATAVAALAVLGAVAIGGVGPTGRIRRRPGGGLCCGDRAPRRRPAPAGGRRRPRSGRPARCRVRVVRRARLSR